MRAFCQTTGLAIGAGDGDPGALDRAAVFRCRADRGGPEWRARLAELWRLFDWWTRGRVLYAAFSTVDELCVCDRANIHQPIHWLVTQARRESTEHTEITE